MQFPADRYRSAGATADQIADLEAAFNALPVAGQQSVLDKIAPMSSYALGESLQDPEPETEAEPVAAAPAPVASAPVAPTAPQPKAPGSDSMTDDTSK